MIKNDIIRKKRNNIVRYIFLPFIPCSINHALNNKKKGLMNSEGWRLKLAIFIHLLAPLISKSKNNIVTNKIIQKIIPNRDSLLMLFKSKKEMKIINAIPQIENIKCLLNIEKVSFREKDKRIPINAIIIINKKLILSISFHHLLNIFINFYLIFYENF
jgi:hypothetical protein|tara:strand:+ start:192 stop:668 length:477 start_codon:yes stop_codon:yes gene_type:complete